MFVIRKMVYKIYGSRNFDILAESIKVSLFIVVENQEPLLSPRGCF